MEITHFGILVELVIKHGHFNNREQCSVATSTKHRDEIWIGEFFKDTHVVMDFWKPKDKGLYNIKYYSTTYCGRYKKKSISGVNLTFEDVFDPGMSAEQYRPYY